MRDFSLQRLLYGVLWRLTPLLLLLLTGPAAAAPCTLDLGSPAPLLSGIDILGYSRELTELRGKWVFVDFWATWCQPCLINLPGVVELHNQMGTRPDFALLSVSLDRADAEDEIREVAAEFGVRFPVMYDGNGWLSDNARNWCVDSIPATFLVDPEGRLVARDLSAGQAQLLIDGANSPSYRPLLIAASERLQPDSPSTGMDSMRDLEVMVDMLPGSPAVNSYQLQVMFVRNGRGAKLLSYAIDIWLAPTGSAFPYRVDIRPQPASDGNTFWASIAPNQSVAAVSTADHPSMAASVDPATRTYGFVVPLHADCTEIAYSLSLFNESLNQFVSNGVRRTRLGPAADPY